MKYSRSRSAFDRKLLFLFVLLGVSPALIATAAITNFVNFETAPVHPVALGPDGRTLAVCHLPDARVALLAEQRRFYRVRKEQ